MFVSSDSEEDEVDAIHVPQVVVQEKQTRLSLIHPDDCYSDEDLMMASDTCIDIDAYDAQPRLYTPIHFSCLDQYTPGSRWADMEYADEDSYEDHLVSVTMNRGDTPNHWFEPIM